MCGDVSELYSSAYRDEIGVEACPLGVSGFQGVRAGVKGSFGRVTSWTAVTSVSRAAG
jgi:hypothetical protein